MKRKWYFENKNETWTDSQKVKHVGNLISELLQCGIINQKEFFILRHRVGLLFKDLYNQTKENNDERGISGSDSGSDIEYREDERGQSKDQLRHCDAGDAIL